MNFLVYKIIEIRGGKDQGDCCVRDFHVSKFNFKADSLHKQESQLVEPNAAVRTQNCERAVKESTIAAGNFYGFERTDISEPR